MTDAVVRIVTRIVLGLMVFAAVFFGTRSVMHAYAERDTLKTQIASERATTADYQRRVLEANNLAEKRAESAERIRTITKETVREVHVRIPADACPLPGAWRVLHDAAAQGIPAPAPGGADAAPVAPQDAADTVVENYGQYHDLADQLEKLQQYVKDQLK